MDNRQRNGLSTSVVGAFVAACLIGMPQAHGNVCSQREATAADAMIDHLDSWDQVNVAFAKYGHCDDGEIAEGTSEAIARLLVDHWDTLPRLDVLVRRNPRLKSFMLRHIDSTLDTDDLAQIGALATSSCPTGMGALCHDLGAAASKADQ